MTNLTLNSIRRFVNNGRLLRIAGTLIAALIICGCEEYPTPYEPGLYPRAAPAGWWDDEGASGKPRIIVHVGEQKAYFYKGKTLVGETTVSTGKPGFSTPPGYYTVLSKDADHVSSVFVAYVVAWLAALSLRTAAASIGPWPTCFPAVLLLSSACTGQIVVAEAPF